MATFPMATELEKLAVWSEDKVRDKELSAAPVGVV